MVTAKRAEGASYSKMRVRDLRYLSSRGGSSDDYDVLHMVLKMVHMSEEPNLKVCAYQYIKARVQTSYQHYTLSAG